MTGQNKSAKKSVKAAKKPVRRFNLKKLVIDRKKWLRGTGAGKLRDKKGKMCCLGFAALACGVPVRAISGKGMPINLSSVQQKRLPKYLLNVGPSLGAAYENDNPRIADKVREKNIILFFAEKGVEVSFIN